MAEPASGELLKCPAVNPGRCRDLTDECGTTLRFPGDDMGSVYIFSDFGKLGKREDSLCFYSPDGSERRVFLHRTDRIVISGAVDISSAALRMIMRNQVDTVFLSKNGRYNGKLEFQESKNVFLRKRQYELLDEAEARTSIVSSIVKGKIINQIHFMQRIGRKNDDREINEAITNVQSILDKLESSSDIDSLRGYEGYCSKVYFSVLRKNIKPEFARFSGRTMHPPKDEVNAVLSFLYTLLLYRVDAAIEMEGLDPYVGNLHTPAYGKRSLTFDLMEEYRSSICDTLCCALFNLGVLVKTDFERREFRANDDDQPIEEPEIAEETSELKEDNMGILLTQEGLKKTSAQFEEKMETLILHPGLSERMSYQKVIIEQVRHYKRVILGEETVYRPFIVR